VATPAVALDQPRIANVTPARPVPQRLGTVGIILLAALAGIAAYWLSALLNFKM
jgi:hypothetical protein